MIPLRQLLQRAKYIPQQQLLPRDAFPMVTSSTDFWVMHCADAGILHQLLLSLLIIEEVFSNPQAKFLLLQESVFGIALDDFLDGLLPYAKVNSRVISGDPMFIQKFSC
jgi:hypothetical protein